jgi:glycosyltransferase involved in cell wall biosynthesis
MKKLAIVIPVYNEEDNIQKVLNDWRAILSKKQFDIIVVNDGSKDNTIYILNRIESNNNHHIKILNKSNGGHGDSIFAGYKYALKRNYEFIFQVDSDDQFSSEDFKKLWKLRNKNFDIILGYRKNRKDPILRVFLSKIVLRVFFFMLFQKYIYDANIPYRLMKKDFLKKFISNCKKKYIAPNILMSLFAKKIISINVRNFQRSKGVIKWPIKKLFFFGIRLIFEIFIFKKYIKKY